MSKPSIDQVLQQAQQAHQREQARFDAADLQQSIMRQLASEPPTLPVAIDSKSRVAAIAAGWEDALWRVVTRPWWTTAAALLPLVIGFGLGSLEEAQSLEQLGDGWSANQTLLTAEPTWAALVEERHE